MKRKNTFYLLFFLLTIQPINNFSQINLILNGDFEQDWDSWTHTGSMYANDNFPNRAHSGTHYAYLANSDGTPGNNLTGGFGQTVFIPENASSASLIFHYSVNTSETATTVNDAFQLYLNNIGTEVLITNIGQEPIGGAVFYNQITYPLLDFKGSNVSISVVASTNNTNPTVFRFDDFSTSIVVDIVDGEVKNPTVFELKQNYPNPFNPSTTISYSLPETEFVTLKIYDLLGREITTLVNEEKSPGTYSVEFDGNELVSGTYIYRIHTSKFTEAKKLTLIK